jgi:hypothetical protein
LFLKLREKLRLEIFENGVLKNTFGLKGGVSKKRRRKLYKAELRDLCATNVI